MKSRKISFALLAAAVSILLSVTAWAAMPAHMWVVGQSQGTIDGSATQQGREGSIVVEALTHSIDIPLDQVTGQPTGKRIHSPLNIHKLFDKSSPNLYLALTTGERLTVKIKFYQISPTGREVHYFSIELEDAVIVAISPYVPMTLVPENQSYGHMETVSFTYRKIKWIHEIEGTESEDDWSAPRQ